MTIAHRFITVLLALLLATPGLAQAQRLPSQAELDRMLAPVALYPDPLLSQVLMAATFPAELVEAARWSRAYPHLSGEDAVRAAADRNWDPSVKALLAFPHLLQRMDEQLEWTRALGEAFLAHEPQVMDTVQQLRQRAYAAGNLRSDERILVQAQGRHITLAPAQPQVVYVPYYDPLVVYGPWWWAAYRPVAWAPWPGYVHNHRPGVQASFWWGAPVAVSLAFFLHGGDWRQRHAHSGRDRHHNRHVNPGHRHVPAPQARPIEQLRPSHVPQPVRVQAPTVPHAVREARPEQPREPHPRPVQVRAPAGPQPTVTPVQAHGTTQARMPAPRHEPRDDARFERTRKAGIARS